MFIVMEIQTNTDSTVGTIINQYESKNEAESKFHQILASASIGELPVHTAIIMTDDGNIIKSECYKHGDNYIPVM